MGKKHVQSKIFSEAPFGSVVEQLARGCLVVFPKKALKWQNPTDPKFSLDWVKDKAVNSMCWIEGKRGTTTFLPWAALPSWGQPGLPLLEQSSARAWHSCTWKAAAFLPQQKQENVGSKECGEGAGSQSCCLGLDNPALLCLGEHHELCNQLGTETLTPRGEMLVTPWKPAALKQAERVLIEFLRQLI